MTRLVVLAMLPFGCAGDCPISEPPPTDLVIEQIRTRAPSIGEATLIVGPDGTSVLIDVANDAHDGAVREAIQTHVGTLRVDWVVLTHYHADHIGGFDALFDPDDKEPVTVARGVVVRGGHVGRGPSAGELEHLEATLTHP
ncbi:MAG: MBL fold metallo-hydrolase, partial [Deltaproteobacteria bacterium]|nr:MBL fold metallo-hydrolase [Deltaproteobacteria bacterium]